MARNQLDMTQGPILGNLLKFSIPVVCSNVLQLLFNAVDTAVVGQFSGENALAAVGSTGSLINLFINLFTGISVGTNVLAARYFGAKDSEKLQKTVHTSIIVSVISGLIITFFGLLWSADILVLIHSPENVLPLATRYLTIYFLGITATMIYNFGSALLRAKGDTRRVLWILLSAGVLNLILNLVFVILLHLDVTGVALATVISQTYSAVLVLILLVREKDDFHLDLKKLTLDIHVLVDLIKIGVPAGLQGVLFSVSNIQIQSSINSFGTEMIAGNSAACSLENFLYQIMNGFTVANLTFCSQNMGAGKMDRITKEVVISVVCAGVSGLLAGNLFLYYGRQLLSLYTSNQEVIDAGIFRMKIVYPGIFICGIMHALGNAIRGIGHSVMPVVSITIGCCLYRVLWISIVFGMFHSPFTIFISYPISWIITSAINVLFFIQYMRRIQVPSAA
ncbi:MAG: MATE family efflux transporter [Treponemataceae bacterium]|nr:MATE family efflux transporter [Treponemataceae bacterium]